MKFPPLDFSKIKTYALAERSNKVAVEDFAGVCTKGGTLAEFLEKLPRFLVANDFRKIVAAIAAAVRNERPVLLMMGAHPIKCGLNPLIVDLMRRGVISAVAFNGAGAIHDFEGSMTAASAWSMRRRG